MRGRAVITGRRTCLRMLAGLAAALPMARIAAARAAPAFGALVPDPESAAVIGRAYLSAYGATGLPRQVTAALGNGAAPGLSKRFRDRIVLDFTHGDVVTVDGWILSRVEAQVCALTALAEDGG